MSACRPPPQRAAAAPAEQPACQQRKSSSSSSICADAAAAEQEEPSSASPLPPSVAGSSSRPLWGWRTQQPNSLSAGTAASASAPGWQAAYWQQQAASCLNFDRAACALKVLLLLMGNVRRSLEHGEVSGALIAAGAAGVEAITLGVLLLRRQQYTRYRRLLMWSNLAAISIMMAASMNQFIPNKESPQWWCLKMLVLLFKMGVTWPIMAALMHRLPWQDLAVLCGAFCVWLCCTWARPLCVHLHSSQGDAAFVRSLAAALDSVTVLGMDSGAHDAGAGAAGAGAAGAAEARYWQPLATRIASECLSANSTTGSSNATNLLSAPECESLLTGQCLAVVTTLTLWVGVLVILFFVVLAEQYSKWRWWHSSGARWQGRPPHTYSPTSGWSFLALRLLYLHVLLDVPLMLLWVGASRWYRGPVGVLGDYNLR